MRWLRKGHSVTLYPHRAPATMITKLLYAILALFYFALGCVIVGFAHEAFRIYRRLHDYFFIGGGCFLIGIALVSCALGVLVLKEGWQKNEDG